MVIFLVLCLCVGACACRSSGGQPSGRQEPETRRPTEAVGTTEPAPPSVTQPIATDREFRQTVKRECFYIFREPRHDAAIAQVLPKGVYTIVEETDDAAGHHWGRLKSGAGWICITELAEDRAPVQIDEATEAFLNSGTYTGRGNPSGEYLIAVRVYGAERLTDIAVYDVDINTDKAAGAAIIRQETLEKGSYLVLWLEFPSDFSTYEIHFTNEAGTSYKYQLGENLSGEGERLSTWLVK